MSDMKKKVVFTAIPLTLLALSGIIFKLLKRKKEPISEEIIETAKDATKDIDSTVTELKGNIEGKSAVQIERTIDNAVENAKNKLDKIAFQIKDKIRTYRSKQSPDLGPQAT